MKGLNTVIAMLNAVIAMLLEPCCQTMLLRLCFQNYTIRAMQLVVGGKTEDFTMVALFID